MNACCICAELSVYDLHIAHCTCVDLRVGVCRMIFNGSNEMDPPSSNTSRETGREFDGWLKDMTSVFKDLTLDDKLKVFRKLLDDSTPSERYYLIELLSDVSKKDIFISLPLELQEHICHFIDVRSLLVACSVCKEWNTRIVSLSEVWFKKYKLIGFGSMKKESANYKVACVNALKFMEGIRSGTVFDHHNINASMLTMEQVTGLHYSEGLLIGSAENQIGIWQTKGFKLLTAFQAPGQISCVQIYKDHLIAVGHNSGCITSWKLNISEVESVAEFHQKYRSHTGVVMSLGVNCETDLMVSGATDFTAKLWSISTGALLKTFIGHTHWVVQVSFLPLLGSDNNEVQFRGSHSLLTLTRDHIRVYSWNAESSCKKEDCFQEGTVVQLPVNSVNKFFTPGCHVVAGQVVYVKQTLFKGEDGDAEILFQDLMTKVTSRKVELHKKVRKLLAIGRRYALLLLPHSHFCKLNLLLVELATGNVTGGCHLPHSSSSTPDLSQLTLGETGWLDDLSQLKADDVIIALGLPRGQIRVVTWRDFKNVITG